MTDGGNVQIRYALVLLLVCARLHFYALGIEFIAIILYFLCFKLGSHRINIVIHKLIGRFIIFIICIKTIKLFILDNRLKMQQIF